MGQMKVNLPLIKQDEPPLGIGLWRLIFEHRKPRYEVFDYIGYEPKRELYFFQSRKEGSVIWRRWEELCTDDFGPFLLDLEELRKNFPELLSVFS